MGICVSKNAAIILENQKKIDAFKDDEEESAQELTLHEGYEAPFVVTFSNSWSSQSSLCSQNPSGAFFGSHSEEPSDSIGSFFEQNDLDIVQEKGYTVISTLGRGASAQVFEVEKDGKRYAMKVSLINSQSVNFLNPETHQPKEEAALLKTFDNQYVIHIIDIIENETCVFVIMELLSGGTIMSFDNVEDKRMGFAQTCAALEYIHSLNIAHRDIKCENILLDENKVAKLCDFGISEYISNPEELTSHKMMGTPVYCAPEVFTPEPYDLKKADVWSLGILLYILMFGKPPFTGKNIFELEKTIISSEPSFPENTDPDLIELINGILTKVPKNRYTIKQIFDSKWMKGTEEKVKKSAEASQIKEAN